MSALISSPDLHSGDSVRSTMITVMLALAPASFVSVYLFGWLAVLIIGTCIGGCMGLEWITPRLMGRPTPALRPARPGNPSFLAKGDRLTTYAGSRPSSVPT